MWVRDIRTGELVSVTSVHELTLSATRLMQSDEVRNNYKKLVSALQGNYAVRNNARVR